MSRLRITISNAGLDWRGTETDTWILARGLLSRGHDVVVFCRPNSAIAQRLQGTVPFEPILSGHDFDPFAIARCRTALRQHRSQIVITQKDKDLRLSGIAAWTMKLPVLVRHVTDRPLKSGLRYRFLFGKVATHHLANSTATLETLRRSAPWLDDDVPIIYNGIDVAGIDAAPRADLELPPDAVTVGYIGAFELRKGILDFAEAWQRVAAEMLKAHAVVAGKGARGAEFLSALSAAPRVHWLGFRDDAASVMKALDIFVMPSHFEGFGLVLAEAMAAGVAPVAYATSNIPELIEDGVTGLLAPVGDAQALADRVLELIRNPQLRRRIACAAQQHIRTHFSAERMIEAHEQLLSEIVA